MYISAIGKSNPNFKLTIFSVNFLLSERFISLKN